MADEQQAVLERLRSQGFEVELKDTGRVFRERFLCYLFRGSLSKVYFGATEVDALEKAVAAAEGGAWQKTSYQTLPP